MIKSILLTVKDFVELIYSTKLYENLIYTKAHKKDFIIINFYNEVIC